MSRGANCISLKHTRYGASVLREPNYENLDNPYLYGMPILFPVNRISNGEFEFEGRKYVFPVNEPATGCHLHGFLHEAEFEVVEHGENYVKCRYISDELYGFFMHKFRVEISYSLSDDGLCQETSVCNLSKENMPVLLGFHTTFNVPFADGSQGTDVFVCAEVGDEIERSMSNYLPTGRILSETELAKRFQEGIFGATEQSISKHFQAINDGKIELIDRKQGIKIRYINDIQFGWRLFYNGNADKYICLEPQTCMVDCRNRNLGREDDGFDFIAPGMSKNYLSYICVEEMGE